MGITPNAWARYGSFVGCDQRCVEHARADRDRAVCTIPTLASTTSKEIGSAQTSSAIAAIAAIEFIIHYHIDYLKERVISERNWSTADAPYWWALGTDQLLHNATYLGMVMVLVRP